ncbi:transglutaminase domain-containing protein [Limnothrix redekei LRLZ20PSL1]|uniref:Transglutaminase domain-containing protein n=1 Tax=Limnothrix redekei LRLZ20PSL1 TaxID=3112953 RepID=A0ABW7C5Z4_9CYAN
MFAKSRQSPFRSPHDTDRPNAEATDSPAPPDRLHRLCRPLATYALRGLAIHQDQVLALDAARGHLLLVDLATDCTEVLNAYQVGDFLDAIGLAIGPPLAGADVPSVWFTRDREVLACNWGQWEPKPMYTLPEWVEGVAIYRSTLYVSSQRSGCIYVLDLNKGREITRFYAPGIGVENLVARGEELWVCDRLEQTVYCLDRATGLVNFSVLTPYESPTALAFDQAGTLWVAYSGEEPYIRDNPNDPEPLQVAFRDRVTIGPLDYGFYPDRGYALSNGYRIEMFYVEELSPLEGVDFSLLKDLEWRISLPANTDRQTVQSVEPVGMPFEIERLPDGQQVAVFKFGSIKRGEGRLFGWKAIIDVRGIRYQLTPPDVERLPSLADCQLPADYTEKYLVDNDSLAMDQPSVQAAAREAIGTETNLLRQMLAIRNYVYDRLGYRIRRSIEPPDAVLDRGYGCCGEYVGVLLALSRLNGIATRTVGRYKCPPPADRTQVALYPDYNHVWLEFFIPGFGWVPMESNPDDIQEGGPYPTRYFMALPWNHVEIAKGSRFQGIQVGGQPLAELSELKVGDLALNHVRFRILEELDPLDRP